MRSDQETDVMLRDVEPALPHVPLCPYCDDLLSIVKGGASVNGLHGECAELVAEEMDNAFRNISE